jgi:hypothetical protein
MRGNTAAWKEIQDSLFGKQELELKLKPDELQSFIEKLSDEELTQFERVLARRGYNRMGESTRKTRDSSFPT